MLKTTKPLPDPEELLLDYAERLTHHRAGRRAFAIAVSKLVPPLRPDDHWRLIENLLQPLVLRHGGEIFRLRNGDVTAVFTSLDQAMADRVMLKLRYLFRDDPLIETEERGGPAHFARCFDIHHEYDAFLAHARIARNGPRPHEPDAAGGGDAAILTPEDLAEHLPKTALPRGDAKNAPLLQWLKSAPAGAPALRTLAFKRPAVRFRPGAPAEIAFEFFEPQLEAVTALGLPRADLERNPTLERRALDMTARRLLGELSAAFTGEQALGVALTFDLVLGAEFLACHRHFAVGNRTPMTVFITHAEAEADPARINYVRNMLRNLGHRFAIGPLPLNLYLQHTCPTPASLDADLLTFAWDPRYAQAETTPDVKALRQWFAQTPGQDIMLTSADTREALNFGQALGLTLFMGRQASALVGRA